ncbi:MAG: TonB-dependent receptor [Chloroherpetonaceae bacterium]|nr:TonB-dependent receptor [Chloroherpetonaceae bacterium]MDW8438541.1 TonB-dependent receptor [Chloroherpetonaceae bacterium]
MKRLYATCIALWLGATLLRAQEKATITGTVVDEKTGEELIGATVRLKGTYYGGTVKVDGTYLIANVNPGEYTIEVTLVGYTPIRKTGVKVKAGERAVHDFKMKETTVQAEEVVVIGERPLIDIEQASTSSVVSRDVLEVTAARDIKEVVASQVGVTQTPFGVYIRGGRSYETGTYIDGVSATDPLAGTGFGVDLSAKALQEVEITTGGAGVEYGEAPAGVIALKTKEGTNEWHGSFSHRRDNLGFSNYKNPVRPNNLQLPGMGWNSTFYDVAFSGPIVRDKLFFFTSLNLQFSDEFMQNPARKLRSSIASDFFTPFNDNRWSGMLKLTWKATSADKFSVLYAGSLNVNQNTQMLQITGNDIQLQPGYQYEFLLNPDNANTYSHLTHLVSFQWSRLLSKNATIRLQLSRLFVNLRADANGRPWRPDFIEEDLDPRSIIRNPEYLLLPPLSKPDSVLYSIAPDGFINSGVAPLWHDHYVEDHALNVQANYKTDDEVHNLLFGIETKFSEYQWIDILRPWVGAPVLPGEPSRRLGSAFDIWRVNPAQGALFVSDKIRYKGLIATIGARLQYWFPGKFADDAVANPNAPVVDAFRKAYREQTGSFFGRRYQLRLLPKINVSFPVTDNQMLYLNYVHSSRLPHPRWVYSGLDARFLDNSANSVLGNPALLPETTVSYEIGLRNQITSNDVLILTAFYNDRFDFIVSRVIRYIDPRTGNATPRATFVNQDYARTRGLEISYIKRIGKQIEGRASFAYQIATGKSNSAEETRAQVIQGNDRNDEEFFLAWDRPIDIKGSILYQCREPVGLFGLSWLNDFKILAQAQFSSGLRYTPAVVERGARGEPLYFPNGRLRYSADLERRFSELGTPWFWIDVSVEKNFAFGLLNGKFTLQVKNLLNNKNATIINPVTGRAYEFGDPLPANRQDPLYPNALGLGGVSPPPFNPARYMPPRQILFGLGVDF